MEKPIPSSISAFSVDAPSTRQSPIDLFKSKKFVTVAAPMVRYSKLPFRRLCANWGCDLTFTPMIVAAEFTRSQAARDGDFTTNSIDKPMIVQFAAKKADELANAAILVKPYCDGIDINCGCPQRWARQEGIGSALLEKPQLIKEMVSQVRERAAVPCSIKIRIQDDLRRTVELAQLAEKVGAEWITVHGRTYQMKSTQPVNLPSIKLVKESVSIPVIANGNVFKLEDAVELKRKCNVDGAMAARGLLSNPALFFGYEHTPPECLIDYLNETIQTGGTSFKIIHNHLMMMLYDVHSRAEKREFNSLKSTAGIIDFFRQKGILSENGVTIISRKPQMTFDELYTKAL